MGSPDGFYEKSGYGRIPVSEIERLKAEVSVERLVERAGIELNRHAK